MGHCDCHCKATNNKKALSIALTITAGIMFLEFWGGLITNSLALLSDSGHMLSDVSALAFSLFALWISAKPATDKKTFGFYRLEILAALFNGVTLFVIAGFIIWEAVHRLALPPAVSSGSMMIIAAIGLVANLLSAWALIRQGDVKDNINLRSAYLHIIGDALGSVGAIVAGLLMYYWNWYIADPIISVIVAVVIFKGAWGVVKQAVHILMEGTPANVDMQQVKATLAGIDGVIDVHDLRVWSLTTGMNSLCCHLLIDNGKSSHAVLQKAVQVITGGYAVHYTAIQVEKQCR
ncbi:MAG TPA: cation diffusion facilitator family transporter [Patescibacteria group bacterium]|nr:cation diffusion facilitator family transporter [Patescibacteria group bacterium]